MNEQVKLLARYLNLNDYQARKLLSNYDRYDIAGIQKRGGVLYAPYATRGIKSCLYALLFGVRADLIGQNKVLLQAQRNIKFCENGFHCVRVGRYTYYADATGHVISKEEFLNAVKN